LPTYKVVLQPTTNLVEFRPADSLVYLVDPDTSDTWDISFRYRSYTSFSFFVSGTTGDYGGMGYSVPANTGVAATKTITNQPLSSVGTILGVAFGEYISPYSGPFSQWIEIGEIEFHRTSIGGNSHILNGGGTGQSAFTDSNSDGLADYFSMDTYLVWNLVTEVHAADANFNVPHQYYSIDYASAPTSAHYFLVGTFS
jgi:hypothetical protein